MKPQGEILVNIFTFVFFEFLYFNMSKGYNNTIYTITIIMLITAINFICSQDNNFSRRDVLIKTLKNAEKLARYDERLTFLCECRRSDIYPKFIQYIG